MPDAREALKTSLNDGVKVAAHFFKIMECILSGPGDLQGLNSVFVTWSNDGKLSDVLILQKHLNSLILFICKKVRAYIILLCLSTFLWLLFFLFLLFLKLCISWLIQLPWLDSCGTCNRNGLLGIWLWLYHSTGFLGWKWYLWHWCEKLYALALAQANSNWFRMVESNKYTGF